MKHECFISSRLTCELFHIHEHVNDSGFKRITYGTIFIITFVFAQKLRSDSRV